MKFRKKPVVIEAIQFDGTSDNYLKIKEWMGGSPGRPTGIVGPTGITTFMTIPTLEGEMTALAGDWIIRGVKGEFYPCKPDIFEATYERVEG